ncbi:hypothetical protein EUTSA_v10002920mg [Eutrema salsugineum]|uniref:Helitron helicase-like domain-containing protein n=1 Tax=Eutrema salsugineum TaxID=72664 RepID=V4LAV8_EUTSA|nr:hypothetical protein EUTSA_v10002920mg [Eutrema salsugineum]
MCRALVWEAESTERSTNGPPEELRNLLETTYFKKNIRVLNSNLAFTSVSAKVDNTVLDEQGVYTYLISGQNHHRMGSLIPPEGQQLRFMQLYIFDTANEIENRIKTMMWGKESDKIDKNVVQTLVSILNQHNHLAKEFRKYLLLFPYGETGFHLNIPYRQNPRSQIKREHVTIREFYAYQIQTRLSEGKTLIKGGRLFHRFVVDAYNSYRGRNEEEIQTQKTFGKRIILPAPLTNGPRYMIENYHNAIAICKNYEIQDHLHQYENDSSNERPDVASRVFKTKLYEIITDFKESRFFVNN